MGQGVFGRLAAIGAGVVLSVVADEVSKRAVPGHRGPVAAAALIGAALVYPLARVGRSADRAVAVREWSAVGAAGALCLGAAVLPERHSRLLAAGGWLAHPGFDFLHERGQASRLSDSYPWLCAGFDLGIAALLCVPGPTER
jgi:hypothetical protein